MLFKSFFAVTCLISLASSAAVKERFVRDIKETGNPNSHLLGQHPEQNKKPSTKLGENLNPSPTEKVAKQKRETDTKLAQSSKPVPQSSNPNPTHVLPGITNPNSYPLEHPKQKRESSNSNGSPKSQATNKQVEESENHNTNTPSQHPKQKRESTSNESGNEKNEGNKTPNTETHSKQKRESDISTSTESANHALDQSKIIQISKGEGTDKKEVIKTTP